MQKRQDIDSWIAHVKDGGLLPEPTLRLLCEKVKEILVDEDNVVHVEAPVTIVADIRGFR